MSEHITIPKAPRNPYVEIERRYDYASARTRCPNCEYRAGGVPWGGWFACEMCNCIALVDGGRAFVPVEDVNAWRSNE